jgi:hypothetical protein
MADIHVGDIGTRFTVTITNQAGTAINVSTATTKELWFDPPDSVTLKKAATFTSNGSDGKIYYDAIAGDLATVGEWHLQAYVVMPSGTWHSDITVFDVLGNL